jgi:hypothetical protein
MKNILTFIILFGANQLFAQIIIGTQPTNTDNTSVLLDFEKTENKGLQIPTVSTLPSAPAQGTILLDAVNETQARVKVKLNSAWIDLSLVDGNASTTRNTKTEDANSKLIIGSNTSTADGVLVLESDSRAMVLPSVTSTDNIINPSPGMMVYVNNTTINKPMLAVYNGTVWTYWMYPIFDDLGVGIDDW